MRAFAWEKGWRNRNALYMAVGSEQLRVGVSPGPRVGVSP